MTLVELLLAVTLFSTLMASATGLLQSGLQSQFRWGAVLEPYQQLERATQRLESDVESAQPFFGVPFAGAEQAIEFARSSPDWVRILYHLDEDTEGVWLIRDIFVWNAYDSSTPPLLRERLLRLASGQFQFGMQDANRQLTWAASWDGTKQGIPRLIKFDCTLPAVGNQAPVQMSRVVRNPSGALPTLEESP